MFESVAGGMPAATSAGIFRPVSYKLMGSSRKKAENDEENGSEAAPWPRNIVDNPL
jgi:hypothetical protein